MKGVLVKHLKDIAKKVFNIKRLKTIKKIKMLKYQIKNKNLISTKLNKKLITPKTNKIVTCNQKTLKIKNLNKLQEYNKIRNFTIIPKQSNIINLTISNNTLIKDFIDKSTIYKQYKLFFWEKFKKMTRINDIKKKKNKKKKRIKLYKKFKRFYKQEELGKKKRIYGNEVFMKRWHKVRKIFHRLLYIRKLWRKHLWNNFKQKSFQHLYRKQKGRNRFCGNWKWLLHLYNKIDIAVLLMKFARNIRHAQQLILKGKIFVDGMIVKNQKQNYKSIDLLIYNPYKNFKYWFFVKNSLNYINFQKNMQYNNKAYLTNNALNFINNINKYNNYFYIKLKWNLKDFFHNFYKKTYLKRKNVVDNSLSYSTLFKKRMRYINKSNIDLNLFKNFIMSKEDTKTFNQWKSLLK